MLLICSAILIKPESAVKMVASVLNSNLDEGNIQELKALMA